MNFNSFWQVHNLKTISSATKRPILILFQYLKNNSTGSGNVMKIWHLIETWVSTIELALGGGKNMARQQVS